MPGVPMTPEQHAAALSCREDMRDVAVRLSEILGVKFAGMHLVVFVEESDGDLQSYTMIRTEAGFDFDAEALVRRSMGNPHGVRTYDAPHN